MDNDPKNFHVDRSPDETGSAVLIWLLSWWMFLIVRLFLCWCYCSCKQQQARTGPAIFVRAESVASDKQIVFTLSASRKITNACCVQVTVDKWLLFILMRKWTGRVRYQTLACTDADVWRRAIDIHDLCNMILYQWFGGSVMVWEANPWREVQTDLYRLDTTTLTAIRCGDEILH